MVKIELNHKGVEELLMSEGMEGVLSKLGGDIANRAGSGYASEIVTSKDTRGSGSRKKCIIRAESSEAKRDNLKNNTLLKAVR